MSIAVACERCHSQFRVNSSLAGQAVHCLNCGFAIHVPVLAGSAPEPPYGQVPVKPQAPRPVKIEPALPDNAPPVPRQVIAGAVDGGGDVMAGPLGTPPPLPRRRAGIGTGNSVVLPPQLDQGPDIRFVPDEVDRFAAPAADPGASRNGSSAGSTAGISGSNSATRLLSGTRDPNATRGMNARHSSDSTIAELPPLEGLLPSGEFSQNPMHQAWPFGPGEWKTPDTVAVNFVLWGLLLCLLPRLVSPWTSLGSLTPAAIYTGLVLAFTGSALFSIKQRFGMGAIAAALAFFAFLAGAARNNPAPGASAIDKNRPANVEPAKASSSTGPAAPQIIVSDPADAHLAQLDHADPAVRGKAMNWLLESASPTRFEEISRALEPRLGDPDRALALLALRGVDLHRDERSLIAMLAVLGDSPSPQFKAEAYRILLDRKDARCLQAIVPRLSEDYPLVIAIIRAIAATDAQSAAQVTDYLEASLSSLSPRQRELAIESLAQYAGPRTAVLLLAATSDREAAVRHAAMRTLARLKDPRAVDALIARLRDDGEVAGAAIEAIGAPAERALVTLLRSSDQSLRVSAAKLLRAVATRDSLEAIRAASADENHEVAICAMEAWKRIDPEGLTPALVCAFDLESRDPKRWSSALDRLVGANLVFALTPEGRTQGSPLQKIKVEEQHKGRLSARLLELALHDDNDLRSRAASLLPLWADESVVPSLIKKVDVRTDSIQRKRAIAALGILRDPRGAVVIADYVTLDTPEVFEALRAMGSVAQDALLKLLEHQNADIRATAVTILRDNADVQAIPALARLGAAEPALKADCQAAIAAIRNRLPRSNGSDR